MLNLRVNNIILTLICIANLAPSISNAADSDLFVLIEVKSSMDSYIQIFYYDKQVTVSEPIKYSESKSVMVRIEASSSYQTFKIKLPLAAISNLFRIDFGNQKDNIWDLKYISLYYGDKDYKMGPAEVLNEFRFNSFIHSISYESELLTFLSLKIDNRCDPFIVSENEFNYYLQKRIRLIISSITISLATIGLFFLNIKYFT